MHAFVGHVTVSVWRHRKGYRHETESGSRRGWGGWGGWGGRLGSGRAGVGRMGAH